MTSRKKPSKPNTAKKPSRTKTAVSTGWTAKPTHLHGKAGDIQSAILSACRSFDANRKRDIVEILQPFQSQLSTLDADSASLFQRLFAFGQASSQKLVEAEQTCLYSLNAGVVPACDFHFVLGFVYASLRDFSKAKENAERYLAKVDILASDHTCQPLTGDSAYRSQMYNVLGGALSELREYQEAEKYLLLAIDHDQKNHLPYVNTAHLLMRTNQASRAGEIVAKGLIQCPHSAELKMIQESLRHRPTVSACMIVKNEEEMLAGCLESIRDWVDEIIVVDTGSTDRTVAIAQSFNAKIFHQPWEGNFSKHRNFSLEQASSEWVFIIDADERFCADDVPVLQRLLVDKAHNALSISVYNIHNSAEETTTFLPSIRFFRKALNLQYKGIVHNSLDVPDSMMVHRAHVRLFHHGYDLAPEKMEKKFQRTKALLEQQLSAEPDNAFAHFNYAQVLRGDGEGVRIEYADSVIRSAKRAVELTSPDNRKERAIHLMALNQLAWTNLYLHDYQKALNYCERALVLKADYLDPLILKGHIFSRMEQYDTAKLAYRAYLDAQAQYDPGQEIDSIIVHHPNNAYIAWYALATIAQIEGDAQRCKACLEKVRLQQKNYLNTNSRFGAILMAEGDLKSAETCFTTQLQHDPNSLSAKLGIAYVHLRRGELESAETCYRNILQNHPGNHTALLKLGYLRLITGNSQQSSDYFANAINGGCDENEVRRAMNDFIGATQNYESAAELYELLLQSGIKSPGLCNEAGGCWFRLAQYSKAEHWFAQALTQESCEPLSLHNLGMARLRQEKFTQAISAFTKYLEKVPSAVDVHLVLGDLFNRTGDLKSAVKSFELFLSSHPFDALALLNLAECYFKMKHHASALLGYRRVLTLDPNATRAKERIEEIEQSAFQAGASQQKI
jgi:tetratricopeptide (TPR) repeat protein